MASTLILDLRSDAAISAEQHLRKKRPVFRHDLVAILPMICRKNRESEANSGEMLETPVKTFLDARCGQGEGQVLLR